MKTFRGPIEGFNNDHDDEEEISDSDEEEGGIQDIFLLGSDEDEELGGVVIGGGGGGGAAGGDDDDDDSIILETDEEDISDDGDEELIDDDPHDPDFEEEGVEGEIEIGSSSSDDEEDPEDVEVEEEGDNEDDEEEVQPHAHGSSPVVLAPSPGPEVEVESDLTSSPIVEIQLHRVYGELDIAGRRLADQNRHQQQQLNGDAAASASSSELSDLSEPEDIPTASEIRMNGNLTPTPGTGGARSATGTPGTIERSSGISGSPRILESADVTEDEEGEGGGTATSYSNPMISAEDEVNGNGNGAPMVKKEVDGNAADKEDDDEKLLQLRGDCIGSTTYSERHVLKILIKWMKQLEILREGQVGQDQEQNQQNQKQDLESEFDNELSFLWDMSSERDVAIYLTDKDVFALLRESLNLSECDRLVEIAIGILVNLLSVRSILDQFREAEGRLQFLPVILSELILCRRIPRLVQALAFLRRLVWYMSTVEVVESWIGPLTEPEFIQAVNFLLKSCRNIGILSELVTVLFMLLEVIRDSHKLLLFCTTDKEKLEESEPAAVKTGKSEEFESTTPAEKEDSTSSSDEEDDDDDKEKTDKEKEDVITKNRRLIFEFCKHGLVISLCESLQELLKFPVIDAELWPTTDKKNSTGGGGGGRGDTNENGLQVIPPNAIQESICLGLNIFEFIHKIRVCREFLSEDAGIILNIYTEFYARFHLYTQHIPADVALDHFAEGLKLIGYYQTKLPALISPAIVLQPLNAARRFKEGQEAIRHESENKSEESNQDREYSSTAATDNDTDKKISMTVTDDLVTSIAVIAHEYLAQLGDRFQLDKIHQLIRDEKNEKLTRFLEFINVTVQSVQEKCAKGRNPLDEDEEEEFTSQDQNHVAQST